MYTPGPQQYQVAEAPQAQPVSQPQDKLKPPAKSKSNGDVGAFIQQCIALCAQLEELRTQAHLIHLNYEAPNFFGVHAFLKEQYEAHQDQFDKLGEFIRSMDYLMPMCAKGLADNCPEFKNVTSYKANDMLITYYKNLESFAMHCKKVEALAAKAHAIDIQNYIAELAGEIFKAAWMLKATLRNS
jgi:DNA-binding ferritin-like protein